MLRCYLGTNLYVSISFAYQCADAIKKTNKKHNNFISWFTLLTKKKVC